ncbi:hypothetical protein MMC22_008919 [Lobaria immixta]|nr:hypothetical protein [Lobaria immixta]
MSSKWSPRVAIVDRYVQIGYTITESIISGFYIWSMVRLLRLKPTVRRQRVMTDLLYVNVVVIAFDFISLGFVYTNQLGFGFPVQTFSYILKLRLEFVVLNQLMDVATRGVRREAFRRNRYYLTANREIIPSHGNAPSQEAKTSHLAIKRDSSEDPAQATSPSPIPSTDIISAPEPAFQIRSTNCSGLDGQISGSESEPGSNLFEHTGITDRKNSSCDRNLLTQTAKPGVGFMLPQASKNLKHWSLGRSKPSKPPALRQVDCSDRGNSGDNADDEEEEEEDIDLHLWDRGRTAAMEVPWFRSKVDA